MYIFISHIYVADIPFSAAPSARQAKGEMHNHLYIHILYIYMYDKYDRTRGSHIDIVEIIYVYIYISYIYVADIPFSAAPSARQAKGEMHNHLYIYVCV